MIEAQTEALLYELCVALGFCLPPDAYSALVDAPPDTPEGFARAVYTAEGLDYDADPRVGLRAAVVERVTRAMDAGSVG